MILEINYKGQVIHEIELPDDTTIKNLSLSVKVECKGNDIKEDEIILSKSYFRTLLK